MVREIARVGANWVALVVSWSQPSVHSSRLSRDASTIPDAVLVASIRAAHAAGLKVLIFPILDVKRRRMGEWRGTIAPRKRGLWWHSYERFILHYAEVARREGAAALLVGSELGSTETWRDRWYHLLSRVQRTYAGTLIYSANWDHYGQVSFWRRLDAIGVTGYFELTKNTDASEAQLRAAWSKARATLTAFAIKRGKPLWITEVGYMSRDGAAIQPWNYGSRGRLDLEEQRRCYAAFRDAWNGNSGLGGVFWWNWYGKGGTADRGYTPKGKPAEGVLRRWFRGRPNETN